MFFSSILNIGLAEVAVAIGTGAQVAQGDHPVGIRLDRRADQENRAPSSITSTAAKRKSSSEELEVEIPSKKSTYSGDEDKGVTEDVDGGLDHEVHDRARGSEVMRRAEGKDHQYPVRAGGTVLDEGGVGQGDLEHVGRDRPVGNGGRPSNYAFYQHTVASHSTSLDNTLAAAGTMIGNIAKGLMEGAGPILNNLIAMHKVGLIDFYLVS